MIKKQGLKKMKNVKIPSALIKEISEYINVDILEFMAIFNVEHVHTYNIKRFNNNPVLLLEDYLKGLPSCIISTLYLNSEISDLYDSINIDMNRDDFIENYFGIVANIILHLVEVRVGKISIKSNLYIQI